MAQTHVAIAAERRLERQDGFLSIADYAAIGDGRTLALVGRDGSIDWMCVPELDAPSVFAALLDPARGGSFSLEPSVPYESQRSYLAGTNVLRTEFITAQGTVRVTEAVTLDTAQNAPWRELVRQIEGVSGQVPMSWRLEPRFEYGACSHDPSRIEDTFVYRHGPLQLGLRAWDVGRPRPGPVGLEGEFELGPGQRALLTLLASDGATLAVPERGEVERRLERTAELWREWVGRSTYAGPWRDAVQRSLLAIRLLADGRSGAIAAAATTSLPEVIGGERNYDYRFAWVRDLCFTVDALLRVGMEELAHASVDWLLGAVQRTHPRVDPVYALTGDVVRSQQELALSGYLGSSPVHVGNQAGSQLQLGGFGDLIETLWHYTGQGHVLHPQIGERLADSTDLLSALWRRPDSGLWELDEKAHYMTSKLSCWAAFERLLDLVDRGQAPARHGDRWRASRDAVRAFIERELWSQERGSYLMKTGSQALDCGALLAARRQFTDPSGPRLRGTIEAIRAELHAGGPLLYRYSGMQDQENAFLACSFWLVEALALSGRRDEAGEIMDQMVALANDVGLYSEEIEPGTHAMRGNFPQALTHLGLISAAAILEQEVAGSG